jgi:hypothetical protein
LHICDIPVANRVYGLHIARGRLIVNGRERLSVADHDSGRIYISDETPMDDRPRVVAIAVALAWRHLTRGMPTLPLTSVVNDDEDQDELCQPEP